jgi:hypothetical protein
VARGRAKSKNTKASETPTASAIDLSLSTQRGKEASINCCELFAKKLGYPSIRDIPQSLHHYREAETFFSDLCEFLFGLTNLAPGTLLQYFSEVYNNLYAKYDIPLFKENVDPVTRRPHWYTRDLDSQ